MKTVLFICYAVALFFLPTEKSFSAQINTIYQADVPVASQLAQDRAKALPQALGQVLVKVSGNSHVLNNPNVKSHLIDANALVQAYSYSVVDNVNHLQVQFDPQGINRLLRNAVIPIWGINRPSVIAWVVSEQPSHPAEIIDNSSTADIALFLKKQAERRGLPLIFPVMDVTDLNEVNANTIATMAIPTLQNASSRYATHAILIVRMVRSATTLSAQAKLVIGADQWGWNITGGSLLSVLNTLIDNVTDALGGRYATIVTNSVEAELLLQVKGISGQDDFAKLMHYLEHLPPIANAEVKEVSQDNVILRISLRGTRDSFIKAISVGNRLTPLPTEPNEKMLVYQWRP